MTRKHKLKLFQLCLLILGVSIIYFTYYKKEELAGSKIIPKKTQERIQKQIESQPDGFEIFSNIEYSGLDLAGNRYILKSEIPDAANVLIGPAEIALTLILYLPKSAAKYFTLVSNADFAIPITL